MSVPSQNRCTLCGCAVGTVLRTTHESHSGCVAWPEALAVRPLHNDNYGSIKKVLFMKEKNSNRKEVRMRNIVCFPQRDLA